MSSAPTGIGCIHGRRPDDLPACVETLTRVHVAAGYPSVWPADPEAWLDPPGLLAAWVVRRGASDDGGSVLGHVAITADVDPVFPAATGRPLDQLAAVTRLFVDPAEQRSGGARALLAPATAASAELDRRLVLDVVADAGPALALYQRLGWEQVGTRTASWTTPDGRRPELRLFTFPAASR
ncbi:Acetyltransferase (GNAT) family protein [Modestobacter sp. DSM 44400]|uniref:GNAT family N-acetyltransferase n=1 Tax=Modestobacter sp. DSM 44400 TaxID=1550230 RepID=UPI0008977CCE|nr:GNAT family N-acetyltransferase [Modestobacter sp. DSM 44400]SDX83480.1 Acetyltransferase (GNAT) family protein [Modestobacter sp. DSM 44400]